MNFTTSTTAISRAYREPKRRECMSAKVLGHDVEAVELVVERLLRQAERSALGGGNLCRRAAELADGGPGGCNDDNVVFHFQLAFKARKKQTAEGVSPPWF